MRYWKVNNFLYTGECCGNDSAIYEAREEPRNEDAEEITEEEYFAKVNAGNKRIEEAKKNPPPPDYGRIEGLPY